MECTAVFSGRPAGKGKDGVGGGPFCALRWLWQDRLMFLSAQAGMFKVRPGAQPRLSTASCAEQLSSRGRCLNSKTQSGFRDER